MTTTSANQVDILLVDDRPENLLALEAILEQLGQRLVRATSGEGALRCLLKRDFAVILLDVQMPGMNGFETAQLIKSRERTKFIPIIFLTAINKGDEHVFEGYSAGAVDYMFKPFQPEILRSKVRVFVDLFLQQRRITEQDQQLRDAERQRLELRHMEELVHSEARFREIVSSAMDAIIAFDADGRITLVNGAAERMFGIEGSDAIGSAIARFFPDGPTGAAMSQICSSVDQARGENGGPATAIHPEAFMGRRESGEMFPIEASVSCLDTNSGRTYTLIVRDVSTRVERDAALERLNKELHRRQLDLEHAMAARSRFYASMSHELRTPINAVLGYSEILLERIYGPLNEQQVEGIGRTKRAARHLLELVNDILDLSKIEAGKIDLRLEPIDVTRLIEDLFTTVRPLADEHGSTLSLEQASDKPITIVSDPRRVRQILLNVLSNAIKFGRGNPITVACSSTPGEGVSVAVTDQGEGIAADDLERVFQEFVQVGETRRQDGTGLGLPISRRLAEAMSGSLKVESVLGKGSTFTLHLPRVLGDGNSASRGNGSARDVPLEDVVTREPARSVAEQCDENDNGKRCA